MTNAMSNTIMCHSPCHVSSIHLSPSPCAHPPPRRHPSNPPARKTVGIGCKKYNTTRCMRSMRSMRVSIMSIQGVVRHLCVQRDDTRGSTSRSGDVRHASRRVPPCGNDVHATRASPTTSHVLPVVRTRAQDFAAVDDALYWGASCVALAHRMHATTAR